jgi:hypothetical protein
MVTPLTRVAKFVSDHTFTATYTRLIACLDLCRQHARDWAWTIILAQQCHNSSHAATGERRCEAFLSHVDHFREMTFVGFDFRKTKITAAPKD